LNIYKQISERTAKNDAEDHDERKHSAHNKLSTVLITCW